MKKKTLILINPKAGTTRKKNLPELVRQHIDSERLDAEMRMRDEIERRRQEQMQQAQLDEERRNREAQMRIEAAAEAARIAAIKDLAQEEARRRMAEDLANWRGRPLRKGEREERESKYRREAEKRFAGFAEATEFLAGLARRQRGK